MINLGHDGSMLFECMCSNIYVLSVPFAFVKRSELMYVGRSAIKTIYYYY